MTRKTNVLFILSDQHNAKLLGHKNHPDVKTPNIDGMAAEGVRFDNAITQNPICTPSRVSFLSGQYCHNHGYYGLSGPNPNGLPTILGHFRRFGYRTGAVGKIHCPEYWVEDDTDFFHDTCGTSIGGRSQKYAQYLAERGLTNLEDHGAMQEFGARGRQTVEGRPSKVSYEDGQEGWAVHQGIEFMAECAANDKPFFLHVSLPKPHQCYTPTQQFWDLYDQEKLTLPLNADYDMVAAKKAPHLIRTANHFRTGKWQLFEPKTYEAGRLRKLHGYLGNVSHVDHAVGELLHWLKTNDLDEDTIVIYSSDHGDYACEHGVLEKAPGICSDAITRIPFIWRWHGHFKSGHKADEIVETVDLVNTLCALAEIDLLETADGKDISHLLRGESGEVHRVGVTEFPWSKSLRKGKYRLVHYPPEIFPAAYPHGFGELYDLETDPWEMKNLYFGADFQEIVHELERELINWLITTTRPTTVHPLKARTGYQNITRYNHSVNPDGKINPENIKPIAGSNYV
jgi:arylsulfatase A-like enzyme